MHGLSADSRIVGRALSMEYEVVFGLFNGVFHDSTGHTQPAVISMRRAHSGAGFDAMLRRIAEAHLFQYPENILPDGGDSIGIERLELPAGLTRADRFLVRRQGLGPLGQACRSSTASTHHVLLGPSL
jgi:hypothetical protein